MSRITILGGGLVVLLAAGCASHVSAGTSPAHATAAASHTARQTQKPAVYLAEGQDVDGTTVQRPDCATGCPLNNLGTVVLYDMSWRVWNDTTAVGSGTETIQTCGSVCSGMPQYRVTVTVTLTRPVKDCAARQSLWTRASFFYPNGVGDAPEPANPWDFTGVSAAAHASCHR